MKDKVLKVLFIISFLPVLLLIFFGIYAAFEGISFMGGSAVYGWEAFSNIIILFGLYLNFAIPILSICFIYQVCCILGYILRKKVEKFRNVSFKEYVIIWSVIGFILFIIWFFLVGYRVFNGF